MRRAKDHLTIADLDTLVGQRQSGERSRRHISARQDWSGKKLDSVLVTIDAVSVRNIETIRLDVDKARRLGEWLIAATFAKASP